MFGKSIAAASALILGLAGTALAQTPSQISQFNAWGAYSYQQGKGKVCYVLSVPVDKQPAQVDHGDNFFMVSQKPGQNVSFEPQFKAGYDLQENSKVLVKIDNRTFSMFTNGSHGWMENAAEEPQLVAALRAGTNMTINAVSKRGTKTSYAYSLKGVSAALKAISDCK
ncbi:invasion associated locus B family protein [Phyllobacterium sp. 21LDTY02-6]|jgi:invasion protein IalB|uniref:invasion associated locus B family protein n=1 Tax=unclassified Phyllobacterium TaxID=2638441 RepID=UPI002021A97C|nr:MULTISPECIES: invasion associated locus B family protein [unclassified Phyllobacterium]MCO4317354.1 invasion associated locus B family protein [Phyllobacterium sp. 21LDTY02-6]MCX8293267.1 invasion associated locus B family protein [Phyllobacterium sp. 0TCS1.6A]